MGKIYGKCLESVSSLVRGIYTVVTDTSGLVEEIEREGHERLCTTNANHGGTSVRENHQPGIEHDGEEDMTPCYDGQRPNNGPGRSGNLPSERKKAAGKDSYHPKCEKADDECQPEPA
jgi:hypothetical protein